MFPPVLPAALLIAAASLAVLFVILGAERLGVRDDRSRRDPARRDDLHEPLPARDGLEPAVLNSLTVQNASSAHYTLVVMTVIALIIMPVVLLYQGWTYHVFRHRLEGEPAA